MLAAQLRNVPKRGKITDWSQKSRALMPLRFATVDYSKMFEQGDHAAMVTMTYPMEWQRLVPDAATFKTHVNALRKRYYATWGGVSDQWAGIWKMEFQRRGAPHLHVGTTVPEGVQRAPLSAQDQEHLTSCSSCTHPAHTGLFPFREWLRREWSRIVFKDVEPPSPWSADGWADEIAKHQMQGANVDLDEGKRYSDPKRIGVYFAKHGLFEVKEYQNVVPELWREKPGARFWGYWVVRPLVVSKETHEALIISIVHHLRKLADRSSYSRRTTLVKGGHNPRTGEFWEARPRKRPVNRRVKRWRNRNGYGYIVVNDGTALAADIARIVNYYGAHLVRESEVPDVSPGETALWAWGESLPPDYFDDPPGDYVGRGDDDGSPFEEAFPVRDS